MSRNIFAYTAPSGSYPEYVSINERDGNVVLTARSRGTPGAVVDVPLPREQMIALQSALNRELTKRKE